MDRSELVSLIGDLVNDSSHERYSTSVIAGELENSLDKWNIHAKIIRDTVTLTTVAGTRQYALSSLTGTPIAFERVTHKGKELNRKEKSWFDLYAGDDWSDDTGTPQNYYIEAADPDAQYITVFPIPQDGDAGANLVVEYIKRHTTMSSDSDTPFNANTLLTPYHWGLAYDVAARILMRDPDTQNLLRAKEYNSQANNVLAEVIQSFKSMEREEPFRIRPTRIWIRR